MCGIIGIVSDSAVSERLLDGLKRLEYRGYDSAGIATVHDGLIDRRSAGSTESSGFQRHVVTAGLQWRGGTISRRPAPAPPPDEAPAVVDGRVRFAFTAPRAASVAVVGSWNDWARDVPAQRLRPGPQPGAWEARLALPPGTYRFQFLVDGRAVSPPAAVRHADDGFGGQDGIVEIQGGP